MLEPGVLCAAAWLLCWPSGEVRRVPLTGCRWCEALRAVDPQLAAHTLVIGVHLIPLVSAWVCVRWRRLPSRQLDTPSLGDPLAVSRWAV